jgi:hypothetical protein
VVNVLQTMNQDLCNHVGMLLVPGAALHVFCLMAVL